MGQGKIAARTGKSKKGFIVFLCLYIVLVAAILTALCRMMTPLEQWLAEYEAAQLEHQYAQVFDSLFADLDWKMLYDLAGEQDTRHEDSTAYASYMEAKVGGGELTCRETASDLAGVHKYNVYLGKEKVAAFTMTGNAGSLTEKPQWTLGDVEIFFERTVSIVVEKKPEHTVYINGVALDDSFTIRSTATGAEEYLPEGIHGYRLVQQRIDGLLVQPEVLVLDEHGQAVPMAQDAQSGIYVMQLSGGAEMTEREKTAARNAAVADALYSMRKITAAELKKYFDENSQVYKDIMNNPMTIQGHKSSHIDENSITVSDFCRYNEGLFSARVKLNLNVIRKDDTVKVYQVDKTYFFGGNDLVVGYTNEPVLERVERVRLTFAINAEEQMSFMALVGTDTVTLPEITVPEGKKLAGWATKNDEGNGTVTMTVRLLPTGEVLGTLEPMALYPVFESDCEAE